MQRGARRLHPPCPGEQNIPRPPLGCPTSPIGRVGVCGGGVRASPVDPQPPAFAPACVMSWISSQPGLKQQNVPRNTAGTLRGGHTGALEHLGTGEGAGTALCTDCKGLLRGIKPDLYINIIYICSTPVSGLCRVGGQGQGAGRDPRPTIPVGSWEQPPHPGGIQAQAPRVR